MTDKVLRVSPEAWTIIEAFKTERKIKTDIEALETFIREKQRNEQYIDYLQKHYDAQKQEPACDRRFINDGKYFCGIKAPRAVEIINLDLCRVCKLRALLSWKQTTKNPTVEPELIANAETAEHGTYLTQAEKSAGFRYCESVGMKVLKSKCDLCKTHSFPLWNRCKTRSE